MSRPGSISALALAALAAGCYANSQRYPGPMEQVVTPLPPGATDAYPAGPEEVLVVRVADPVHVQRPGEASSFPLHHFRKQARMNSGSWVFCGAGGRVGMLFPGNSQVKLYGHGSGVVGSQSRGEPLFFIKAVDRAQVTLTGEEQVQLLGGAVLAGDGGPYVIEHVRQEILRVRNRSQGMARIAYRDSVFQLAPGALVDLPLLEAGIAPIEVDPGFQTLVSAGVPIQVQGDVSVVADPRGTRLRATGVHELRGFGLVLRLDAGDEVLFGELAPGSERPSTRALEAGPESR